MTAFHRLIVVAVLSLSSAGCGLFGGLRVEPVATSVQKPSNVAVYMTVAKGSEPVTGLSESNFKVYEDGQLLSAEQSQQTLLPRDVAAVHRALLLVDMSGASKEDESRERVSRAAARFVTKVRKTQPVTVYAFDGGRNIRSAGEYPKGDQPVEQIPALSSYTSQDPSSNLNAAVIEALKQLDVRLMTTARPVRVGTLVVFARGPDLAGRVTEDEMLDAVDESDHHVFAIGLEDSQYRPGSLGKSDTFMASSLSAVDAAFDEAATRTAAIYDQHYLLSYCSPARAGDRSLRIEVETTDGEGGTVSGSLSSEFNADGFSSGCNPKATPRFVIPPKPKRAEGSRSRAPASRSTPADTTEDDAIVPPPDKPGYAQ